VAYSEALGRDSAATGQAIQEPGRARAQDATFFLILHHEHDDVRPCRDAVANGKSGRDLTVG
jgi:hypothetical protein